MLCCLVSDCPNGKLPSTVSGLFFAMINRNLYLAARKKAGSTEEVEEQWNLSGLDSRIVGGSKNNLQEFGRLCVEGMKTGLMSFTSSDITGQIKAKTIDVKVTRLIEAGVLDQDTNERNPRYQVPHRTTAEFLATYCLSREKDKNLCQQNLLDLFLLKASFDEVAASLIEMGKTRCLTDAFRDNKFPGDQVMPFMKSYFTQHGAAGPWSEFEDALPNKLRIKIKLVKVTVSSAEPRLTVLQVFKFVEEYHTTFFVEEGHAISEVARILQELLKSHSCPVQLSFDDDTKAVLTEAMQEVPEGCRLKHFKFLNGDDGDTSPQVEVLAEKWLSHLQHLGLKFCNPKPILKRLQEPGCSLTSLHLSGGELHIEDLMMLASKLETLSLDYVKLYFDVTEISKYAVKERCSLRSLHLKCVNLSLKGSLPSEDENQELLLACRNVALHLEELEIDDCVFPIELFSWLNLSLPNLRTVTIDKIHGNSPNGGIKLNQVLEALTRSSGDSIEELSLLHDFWGSYEMMKLHPIREALQRCPRVKSVNLGYSRIKFTSAASIGPGPLTPLSPSDEEALKSDNIYYALLKIVLSVPKRQTLTCESFFSKWKDIGTFHAIADKAEKWPGETNDNDCILR